MSNQPTATENMHKVVYLANEYPGKSLVEFRDMCQMPLIDFNAAIWLAEDLGYMTASEATNEFSIKSLPEKWELGDRLKNLVNTLMFIFQHIAKDEKDLMEIELNQWMAGHPVHDQFIAVKFLINKGFLSTYEVVSKDLPGIPATPYTFYCLAMNVDKRWGVKQFKDQKKLK